MSNNDIVSGLDDDKDDSLKIKLRIIEDVDSCLILTLTGYIDTYNSNFFQKCVQKVIDAGYIRMIFQCGSLNYISSTGIGSFTTFLKAVKPQGGDIVMLDVQPKVYEVFQLLGFSQIFNVKENLDEAINHFHEDHVEENLSIFPLIVSCPLCGKKLKAAKSGRFRCSECKSIIAIDKMGNAIIG